MNHLKGRCEHRNTDKKEPDWPPERALSPDGLVRRRRRGFRSSSANHSEIGRVIRASGNYRGSPVGIPPRRDRALHLRRVAPVLASRVYGFLSFAGGAPVLSGLPRPPKHAVYSAPNRNMSDV
jgi:hypothetical protein